ncbi:MAG: DUF1460 domain-containing protein [Tannerellaceae bacterium]|jgi:hypothetical protein|nr:DUF1460 domain-containing protein [Tannerellaceae bacterium]
MKTNLLAALFLISPLLYGQTDSLYCTPDDREVFNHYLAFMEEKDSLPFDSLLLETATFFLGTPYVGATLEQEPEGLVANLRELDCFTFVENVIALARTLAEGDATFEKYLNQLRNIRYRNGIITGYVDRLHYTSDWLYENDRKQILAYTRSDALGIPHRFQLDFMSSHPDSYRQLKADTSLIASIREAEQQINSRTDYYYLIPKQEIDSFALHINNGDVVGFATAIPGLDISHVGIITRQGETLTFIHASSTAKEVIVHKESLKAYVEGGKNCIGILTAKPLRPIPAPEDTTFPLLLPSDTTNQNNSKANLIPTP